jgi:uncharacterized hydrophobic protein (TIGR00271 family)
MSDDERAAITGELFLDERQRRAWLARFFVLIVLSTLIAAFGLVANSVAVIIGAMLIAPLMTPILAVSASLLLADIRRLLVNAVVLLAGTVLAIVTAMGATWIGLQSLTTAEGLPSEILARTEPSLIDLGVAVAAGLAGGYVVTHPRASASLPGVAIAVALVPPLATTGITFQLGAGEEAAGALLLFATNLFAIVLAAIAVMLASGFIPIDIRRRGIRSARIGLIVSLLLVIAVGIPLAVHTVDTIEDQRFTRTVAQEVANWDPNSEIVSLTADVLSSERAEVELTVATTSVDAPPAWRLADSLSAATGRVVEISVRFRFEEQDASTSG